MDIRVEIVNMLNKLDQQQIVTYEHGEKGGHTAREMGNFVYYQHEIGDAFVRDLLKLAFDLMATGKAQNYWLSKKMSNEIYEKYAAQGEFDDA